MSEQHFRTLADDSTIQVDGRRDFIWEPLTDERRFRADEDQLRIDDLVRERDRLRKRVAVLEGRRDG